MPWKAAWPAFCPNPSWSATLCRSCARSCDQLIIDKPTLWTQGACPKKHKNAYNALWNGATGRFILSCFVGDVAVLRKLARLNKKILRNYDSKRKFVGFLELLTWFEQATCSLRVSCSTSWATVADKIFLHVLQREIFYHTSCALSRFDFAAEQVQIVCDTKI